MHTQENHRNALPTGHQLQEYQIRSLLGHGGFGITYLAHDTKLYAQVAIKEYLPNEIAVREGDYTVLPKSPQDANDFAWGLDRFLQEARTLAQFKHPNIVRVWRFFEAHNTAYIVMEYEQGQSLASALKDGETATEAELQALLPPLLDGLETVHKAGYLHRDIKPGNIYLRDKDQSPVLIDFGAARYEVGSRSRSVTQIVTPGYSPFEQYQTKGHQGPWTDIYALGAVLYRTIGGTMPLEATERIDAIIDNKPDPQTPAVQVGRRRYSKPLLQAIDWALQAQKAERPQNVTEWAKAIFPPEQPRAKSLKRIAIGLLALLVIGTIGVYFAYTAEQVQREREAKAAAQAEAARQAHLAEEARQQAERLVAGIAAYNRGDYATVLEKLKPLAEQGNAEAQNNLGVMYEKGKGVAQNNSQAIYWYRKAAEQEHALGQNNLGFMYHNGKGVARNNSQAVYWYRKAAEQGHALGQYNLGLMYRKGKGVAQDYTQAVYWYRKAAEQGHALGQNNLGVMYENGKGVAQNDTQAVYWYRKAAEQGNAYGQYNLGDMYEHGKGVPTNKRAANKWYRKAAAQGHTGAKNKLMTTSP